MVQASSYWQDYKANALKGMLTVDQMSDAEIKRSLASSGVRLSNYVIYVILWKNHLRLEWSKFLSALGLLKQLNSALSIRLVETTRGNEWLAPTQIYQNVLLLDRADSSIHLYRQTVRFVATNNQRCQYHEGSWDDKTICVFIFSIINQGINVYRCKLFSCYVQNVPRGKDV